MKLVGIMAAALAAAITIGSVSPQQHAGPPPKAVAVVQTIAVRAPLRSSTACA